MKKKYILTGGSGFLGKAIATSLLKKNNKVIIVDNNFRNKKSYITNDKNLKVYNVDIRDKIRLKKICKKVDVVIHLAFINGTNFFYEKPELVLDVAVKGIINILEICKENKIKEFFLASSSEVYQEPAKIPTDEKVPLTIPDPKNPRYSYATGKIVSEVMLLNTNFFKRAVIFRPHNIYGPDMGYNHVIPEIILKISKSNKLITMEGNGQQTRAFCYINDFVNAFNLLLIKAEHKNIYNIGTEDEIKIKDLVNKIVNISKKNIKIKNSKEKLGGTSRRCPKISKIKKIGFSPKTRIDDGLLKTFSWYTKDLKNEI